MIGLKFGRLLVMSRQGKTKQRKATWLCQCDCGNTTVAVSGSLKSGNTTSCGCFRDEKRLEVHRVHGLAGTPIYSVWQNMRRRCSDTSDAYYADYGGRGITVCDSWAHSFESFYRDMGDRPFKGAQIDRIDNALGYSPENCRWVTPSLNCRNRRDNKMMTFNGESHCLTEWAEITGFDRAVLKSRISYGWPIERILTEPLRVWPNKSKGSCQVML